jgi:hypothetical protein
MRFNFSVFLVVVGLFVSIGQSAAADSLYPQFSRKGTVKIFVADPSDTSSNKKTDLAVLKKQIEEALAARKSLKFVIMPVREDADVQVEIEIVEYYWTNHDPLDMIMGTAGAAYDAITIENYSRLQATIAVKDTKAGRPLWQDKVRGSVTDKTMTEIEGPKRAGEKLSQEFVIEAFGKKRQSSR